MLVGDKMMLKAFTNSHIFAAGLLALCLGGCASSAVNMKTWIGSPETALF
jgi:hypothetical protein